MIRTRFAPSPTGYLHIGGVRTALFNWLFARGRGGKFILRIDDTDADRHVEGALRPILEGFRWLGIDWDEGPEVGGAFAPYFQSERLERHQAAAADLVERGCAYWDYATPAEIEIEREAAKARGAHFVYSRRWKAESAAARARYEAEGRSGVVRLLMPREGTCELDDLVRGRVSFEWAREQDHVIQRADGSCLYHLASAVDDHDMAITHVIRAEEHLSNTPRQIFISKSLGYELPEYGHLPFVAEPGAKSKLSKRKLDKYGKNPAFAKLQAHGNTIAKRLGLKVSSETFNPLLIEFYERVGYLPQAIVNYLLLVGWSLDDRTEFFSREEMLAHFSLERVNKAPASFDPDKLSAFQEHYAKTLPLDEKVSWATPYLERAGLVGSPPSPKEAWRIRRVVQAASERIKVGGDILDYPEFFVEDARLEYDEGAFDKRVRKCPEGVELLRRFAPSLERVEPFEAPALEQLLQSFTESAGVKTGALVHTLRVAVTGKAIGFGLFDALAILGRESSLRRIEGVLASLTSEVEAGRPRTGSAAGRSPV
jgi:glutamyl-tRNA synthetase